MELNHPVEGFAHAARPRLRSFAPRRRNESGQAMVEFALILIPLLILVVGIIQFGIGLNYWLDMNRLAARHKELVRHPAYARFLNEHGRAAPWKYADPRFMRECLNVHRQYSASQPTPLQPPAKSNADALKELQARLAERRKAAEPKAEAAAQALIRDLKAYVAAGGKGDFRFGEGWRKDHPRLVAWLDGFAAKVPAYAATKPG